jgi:O-antigen biosynthesis protein WbqP
MSLVREGEAVGGAAARSAGGEQRGTASTGAQEPRAGYPAKRVFDVLLALVLLPLLALPMLLVALAVKLTSRGPVLHWSSRVGRREVLFLMPKFRTMRVDAPQLATHIFQQPELYLTSIGGFLRRTSLDELPQIFSILKGDMSFVGPRPALFNQDDLVEMRRACGIHQLVPGLTGWAQIMGRDHLSLRDKVQYDHDYLQRQSLWLDLRILLGTLLQVARRRGVCW